MLRRNFHLGFDYYPEHWEEEMWPEDLRLMREAGVTCVRIAEYAWSRMEPEEGRFEFDWLDRFYALAEKNDIRVILGTPTSAAPPWAWRKYPDLVLLQEDGQRCCTTSRRYNCPTSPDYLRLCDRIIEEMAKRYGQHPLTIGWQTDNEISGQVCFCEHCQTAMREHLKEKFGTVEALNQAMGLVFWAHEVTDWDQVVYPRPGMDHAHPSLRLEMHRFFSRQWSRFAQRQTDLIRKRSPGRFVTHNLAGYGSRVDLFDFAAAHDFLSMDLYPKAMIDPPGRVALANDVTFSAQNRPHWVLELQTGTPCTKFYKAPVPREGQLRLWAHQCAAHGAEGVVYFRWRKSPVGQEMFGNGLLDQDARPRRQYAEIQKLGEDFRKLAEALPGYHPASEVAVVYDFAERINAEIHSFAIDTDYWNHLREWWEAARALGLNVRFVRPTDDLRPFRLVLAPQQYTTSPEIVANFTNYVREGGTLVGAHRMGWFDVHGKPSRQTLPGGMTALFGAEVEEYERVMDVNPNRVVFNKEIGPPAECRGWNYYLNSLVAKPLGTFESQFYAGRMAASEHSFGKGRAIYVGTQLGPEPLKRLVAWLGRGVGLPLIAENWPKDVELARLTDFNLDEVWALLNHSHEPRAVELPKPATDLLSKEESQRFEMAPLSARWVRL
ncbi:MAG: beta-galactosidase [Candidatus Sumerlaeota bacterium]|nr:beta-galactosidase [Candidatus Sumerlaeota bacterium]